MASVALGPGARGGLEEAAAPSHAGGACGGHTAEQEPDESLASRCRAGDPTAFEAIVKRHEADLVRHCARMVGASAAQDAAQDAFLAAWRAMEAGAEIRSLRPWLYTIAHRKAIAILRDRRRQPLALPDALAARVASADEASQRARVRDALAALAALPEPQREALVGIAVHGRSGRQLARQLGVADCTVRQLVYRARETLRAGAASCLVPPLLLVRLLRRAAAATHRAAALTASGAPDRVGITTGLVRLAAAAAAGTAVAGGVVLSSSAGQSAHRTPAATRVAAASRFAAGAPGGVAALVATRSRARATSRVRTAARAVTQLRSAIVPASDSPSLGSAANGGRSSGAEASPPSGGSGAAPAVTASGGVGNANVPVDTDATNRDSTRSPNTIPTPGEVPPAVSGSPGGAARSTAAGVAGTVSAAGRSAAGTLAQGVGVAADVVSTITQGVAAATQGAVSTVTQGAAAATQGAVSTVTQGAAAATQGAVSTVTQAGSDAVQGAGSALTQATGSSASQTPVSGVTQVAGSAAEGAASSVTQTAGSAGQAASGSTKKTLQGLTGAVGQSLP